MEHHEHHFGGPGHDAAAGVWGLAGNATLWLAVLAIAVVAAYLLYRVWRPSGGLVAAQSIPAGPAGSPSALGVAPAQGLPGGGAAALPETAFDDTREIRVFEPAPKRGELES